MDLHLLAQTGLWNDTSNRTINGSSKHETDRDMSGGLGNGDNALRRHLSRHESESAAWSRKQASKREHGIASVQRLQSFAMLPRDDSHPVPRQLQTTRFQDHEDRTHATEMHGHSGPLERRGAG